LLKLRHSVLARLLRSPFTLRGFLISNRSIPHK
jgi:hypothetical protein